MSFLGLRSLQLIFDYLCLARVATNVHKRA